MFSFLVIKATQKWSAKYLLEVLLQFNSISWNVLGIAVSNKDQIWGRRQIWEVVPICIV